MDTWPRPLVAALSGCDTFLAARKPDPLPCDPSFAERAPSCLLGCTQTRERRRKCRFAEGHRRSSCVDILARATSAGTLCTACFGRQPYNHTVMQEEDSRRHVVRNESPLPAGGFSTEHGSTEEIWSSPSISDTRILHSTKVEWITHSRFASHMAPDFSESPGNGNVSPVFLH